MHYVLGDIHNEIRKLNHILEQIQLTDSDKVIVLGDLFDRGGEEADPVGVYFALSELQDRCIWLRGNHDEWLADYIKKYFALPKRQREKMTSYFYNSFDLMKQRLTKTDMLHLAERIHKLPFQEELEIEGKKFLFAHAMTSSPAKKRPDGEYLMGNLEMGSFFLDGIDGYISFCGHTVTDDDFMRKRGKYLDEYPRSVWTNDKENVYLMDCGCGFTGGKLACICLESGERFYS
ncbi:MAG: metallophosphoesterase [Lachnoclostridium sp.]|nr:metallophosphoesterase [Lachnospira sp.]MCM1249467.1 metallophosphoesterase [Lachnoclostridium sp.]MCM1536267.1 metallophosphoesterase [Clostridium sp.]